MKYAVSRPPRTEKTLVRVLFIGNSQIASNDLPGIVRAIPQSAPQDLPRIEAYQAVVDGASLQQMWDANDSEQAPRAMIAARKYDFVVIQEIFCADPGLFEQYAAKFDDKITKAGSKTILFATANTSEFSWPSFLYPDSFLRLNEMQIAFGRKRNIPVAAAGFAWMKYLGPNPTAAERLALYATDKAHPGIRGSHIYAYLLYAHLTGWDPRRLGLGKKDEDSGSGSIITAEEMVRMQAAAWEQYQEDNKRLESELS